MVVACASSVLLQKRKRQERLDDGAHAGTVENSIAPHTGSFILLYSFYYFNSVDKYVNKKYTVKHLTSGNKKAKRVGEEVKTKEDKKGSSSKKAKLSV